MNLIYYSLPEDKVYEYNSGNKSKILNKIDGFDFIKDFELSIAKENNLLHILKLDKNYHLSLIEFHEGIEERIGINVTDFETVKKFITDYINELNYSLTKNSFEKHHIIQKEIEKEKFNKWKLDYDKKRDK